MDKTSSIIYGMYFQDQTKGYFRYKDEGEDNQKVKEMDLIEFHDTEAKQKAKEVIKHVFFNPRDDPNSLVLLSQVFDTTDDV